MYMYQIDMYMYCKYMYCTLYSAVQRSHVRSASYGFSLRYTRCSNGRMLSGSPFCTSFNFCVSQKGTAAILCRENSQILRALRQLVGATTAIAVVAVV